MLPKVSKWVVYPETIRLPKSDACTLLRPCELPGYQVPGIFVASLLFVGVCAVCAQSTTRRT